MVVFDTVFTTVGSVTKQLRIYNTNRSKVNISRIYLAGAAGQRFRMNVDGVPGREFNDIELDAGDSLYIFVEVTLSPNSTNNPLLVSDSIIFVTNGNQQDVDLLAWGQDAYFHTPPEGSGSLFFNLPCNETWANDKPHVVYGWAVVDSACNLTIQPGTQVHFHPNAGLLTYKSGTLTAVGTPTDRIAFKGDRLETRYDSVPGQWSGLIFLEAGPSTIEYADIRNGSVGVRVETISGNLSLLEMNQVRIENMSAFGVWNYKAGRIRMNNCLVNNCGQYAFVCTGGGDIFINLSTFANYWSYTERSTPSFAAANYFEDQNGVVNLVNLNLEVHNSVIYGNKDDEFVLDFSTGATANHLFNHCFIKSESSLSNPTHFNAISRNVDPVFRDPGRQNYRFWSTSPCINAGDVNFSLPIDLNNNVRTGAPDVGCFEYYP